MTNLQIRKTFIDKKEIPCPITNRLINSGYVQKSGGYIANAKKAGIDNPTQYWHLISSWSSNMPDDARFTKIIQCGELLVWMCEVLQAVPTETLNNLVDYIINNYTSDRRTGNRIIQNVCFDSLERAVLLAK